MIGSLNNIMNSDLSDVHGVNNHLTADKENGSSYAMLSGYGNKGKNIQHTTIVGSENTVENGSSNVVIGDKHKLTKVSNSIILGSTEQETETTVSDVVSIGHNAKVEKEGGIALGSSSVANREKGQAGFDISTNLASTNESAIWKATHSALSIGDGNTVTRQITGVAAGSEDTDAVNVAQLKALKESTEENTKEMTKKLYHLGEEIDGVRSEARGIGALSASLAALHPMQYDKAKPNQVMAGVGTYRDKQAVAVGMTHYFTENLMMTAGVSLAETSNTKAMANVGVTWKFGKGDDRENLPEVYKEGPISSIQVMQGKMMNLENINKEQQTKIEMLEKQVKLLLENR